MNFDKNGLLNGISNADYQKLFTAWKADQQFMIKVGAIIVVIGVVAITLGAILALLFYSEYVSIILIAVGVLVSLIGGGVWCTTSYNLHNNPELHFIQSFTNVD
ncbi:hypothetical protein [Lacticaseibacillus salsurivasis]|uniref:hypothetical protein n=1 Tax=Lacticaseibacillus salsurivasis TaxID=3081441 RepID=UPI0030C6ABBD